MTDYLFRDRWPAKGLARSIAWVRSGALRGEYRALRGDPPRRSQPYLVEGHDGTTRERPPNARGIQYEQRYAMALWNLERAWPRPDGGRQWFLDYQVPLKAVLADHGIGKVDLLSVTDRGRLIVVELKFPRNGRGDSPMHALMEGLRYAAIVEGRTACIAKEVEDRFHRKIDYETPPIVQILGPRLWWRGWFDSDLRRGAAGDWNREFGSLASQIEKKIGVTVECMATDTNPRRAEAGLRKGRPMLDHVPSFYSVRVYSLGFDRLPSAECRG